MFLISRYVIGLAAWCSLTAAQGSISLNGTRVVLNEKDRETSLVAHNQGGQEVLIQSWLEGGGEPSDVSLLAITPPLVRLPAAGKQQLRVLYQGRGLPDNRESVFWINVQEIPHKAADRNVLQFAVRQRIKLFFRPGNLPGSAQQAPAGLQWHVQEGALIVRNPTVFHVSLASVQLSGEGYAAAMGESRMVRPAETATFNFKGIPAAGRLQLQFESINDFGGLDSYVAEPDRQAPVQARLRPAAAR